MTCSRPTQTWSERLLDSDMLKQVQQNYTYASTYSILYEWYGTRDTLNIIRTEMLKRPSHEIFDLCFFHQSIPVP
jgi:hypothetical protein